MKVFATYFLEEMKQSEKIEISNWNWTPKGEAKKIYASGASTSTRTSTYAGEKDDRSDTDRPNEGLMAV